MADETVPEPTPEPADASAAVRPLSRRKRALFTAVLASVSLVLAALLGEAVARVATPAAAGPVPAESLYEHDALLGWRKRASATVSVRTSEYAVTQTTNALGLRGPETTLAKPPDRRRVLLLGDSFLEGYTVDRASLVSTRLERLLGDRLGGAVEVLNAGTAGYSTDQELLYFREEGRRLEPDVTVVMFYVNDVYFNAHGSYWRGEKPYFELEDGRLALRGVPVPEPDPDRYAFEVEGGRGVVRLLRSADAWLGSRSALHRLVRGAITGSPTLSGLAIRLGAADVPGEFRPWQREPEPDVAASWDVTAALLAALRDEVEAAGSAFHLLYIPSRPAVYDDDWARTRRAYALDDLGWSPSADAERLREVCGDAGLACTIPIGSFRAEARRLEGSGRRLYFDLDGHWTADGHRLAAEILVGAVEDLL